MPYMGVLYLGLMITKTGPKLVEYNCRFGDPECQVLMPRLKSDLLIALLAAREGKLQPLQWRDEVALTVVMASKGYPGAYEKGHVITGLDEAARMPGITLFHAGTEKRGETIVAVGGRVLNVTALGKDVAEAQARAYAAVAKIHWQGVFCRKDIGWRESSAKALSCRRCASTRAGWRRSGAEQLTALAPVGNQFRMLLLAGFLSILAGLAALLIDRPLTHFIYDHIDARAHKALDGITHYAKAGHWLAAAILALILAAGMRHFNALADDATQLINYSLAFIASLTMGSAVLHVIKLVLGRRRPRDDMEMGLYGFIPLAFNPAYNSFPVRPCAHHLLRGGDLHLCVADVVAGLVCHRGVAGGDARAAHRAFH